MSDEFADHFWRFMCGFDLFVLFLVALNVTFILLALASAPFVPRGTPEYVVLRIVVVLAVVFLSVLLYVLNRCGKREEW